MLKGLNNEPCFCHSLISLDKSVSHSGCDAAAGAVATCQRLLHHSVRPFETKSRSLWKLQALPVHCRGVRKSNLHFNRGNGEWSVAAARAPWRAEQSPPIMSDTSLIERHGYATACQRKTRFIILCWSHACDLWRHCFFFCLFVWTCLFILDSEVRI